MDNDKVLKSSNEPNGSFDGDFLISFFKDGFNIVKPTNKQVVILSLLKQLGAAGYRYPKTPSVSKFLASIDLYLDSEPTYINKLINKYVNNTYLEENTITDAGFSKLESDYILATLKQAEDLCRIRKKKKQKNKPVQQRQTSLEHLKNDTEFLSMLASNVAAVGVDRTGQKLVEESVIKVKSSVTAIMLSVSTGVKDFIVKYGNEDDLHRYNKSRAVVHKHAISSITTVKNELNDTNKLLDEVKETVAAQIYSAELIKYLTGKEYLLPLWVSAKIDDGVVVVTIDASNPEYKDDALATAKLMRVADFSNVKHSHFIWLKKSIVDRSSMFISHII